jgi:hypothetical protein
VKSDQSVHVYLNKTAIVFTWSVFFPCAVSGKNYKVKFQPHLEEGLHSTGKVKAKGKIFAV